MPLSLSSPTSSLLSEQTSIQFLQDIQQQAILTPLHPTPISTSFIHAGATNITPILILHGFDSSLMEFRRLVPQLAASQEVWAMDLLGFGFTERPEGISYSPDSIQQHLYACWQTWINRPVVLVGASMGGAAAIAFALAYPDAVQQLVLIDSAGYTEGPNAGKWLIPPLGFLATEFLRNPKVRQSISQQAYFNPIWASDDARRCAALHLIQPRWREALIAFTKSGGYRSVKTQLPRLTCPTLILWGDSDRILGTQDAQAFHEGIPQSKLVWIKECGHVPHLEKPEEIAQEILKVCDA